MIVRFRAGADAAERAAARAAAGTELEHGLAGSGLHLVDPQPGVSPEQAIDRIERSEDVLYAEPDELRTATLRPNDRHYRSQWGLPMAGLPGAWNFTTGSAATAVGVLDSGIDYSHADLAPNMWRNPGESGDSRETNGLDDDGNGLVDDLRGWDWIDDDNVPADANGHGTHVAGTIGARGNDFRGVAGVAWRTGLVPLRVLDANGSGRVSDIVAAYGYAARAGLPVVNASLAGPNFSQAEYDAIRAASQTLVVVAAGNDSRDNDVAGSYPCNQPLPNVICVAATDQDDTLAGLSNFGRRSVDLAAPGVKIMSTLPGGGWGLMSGTSMAAPHVAGTAALIASLYPEASVAARRAALLSTVDGRPSLAGRTLTGGRLNAERALSSPPTEAAFPPDPGIDPARPPQGGAAKLPAYRDGTPPRVFVHVLSRPSLRSGLRRGLRLRVRCSEACALRVLVSIPRARISGSGAGPRRIVVGKVRGRIGRAGARVIHVRIGRRSRRLLRRDHGRVLSLRTLATDAAGNRASVRRAVRLRR